MDLSNIISELDQNFKDEVAQIIDQPEAPLVEELRIRWLGKKGKVADLYNQLKGLDPKDRPVVGKQINSLKELIDNNFIILKQKTIQHGVALKLSQANSIDISLPIQSGAKGSLHPVTLMQSLLLREFRRFGFSVWSGPEIESDYYNFSALNFPQNHPSRDMQDTFFVDRKENQVLRTHTSNIQIHAMLETPPPLRLVAPGRVYRCDNDPTHSPMFHQLECVLVDRNISMAHLKGIVDAFLKSVYGSDLKTRFRPSFFPFVEPGAEVDLQCAMCAGKGCRVCSHTGWLEVGGCGMIHPNVFENVGYDSEEYTGFAFGFGIDRLAMLAYGIDDLRLMFEGDQQFQSQFHVFN